MADPNVPSNGPPSENAAKVETTLTNPPTNGTTEDDRYIVIGGGTN